MISSPPLDDLDQVKRILQLSQNAHSPASLWTSPLRRHYSLQQLNHLRHTRILPLPNHIHISKSQLLPLLTSHHPSSSPLRTNDVLLTGSHANLTFADLMLPPFITTALSNSGLIHPSPVQLQAIPVARLGADLIAQAKSGTGKTVVFTVVALETVAAFPQPALSVIILSPTRELAIQIASVLIKLSAAMQPNPAVALLIGGVSEKQDAAKFLSSQPHIVVATPGRLLALINRSLIQLDSLQLLVLDEADKLLHDNYDTSVPQICSLLPKKKQTLAFSATYTPQLRHLLNSVMRNPKHIRLFTDTQQSNLLPTGEPAQNIDHSRHEAVLQGIRQKKCTLHSSDHLSSPHNFRDKLNILLNLLATLPFSFCMLFTNDKPKAPAIAAHLVQNGFSSLHTSAALPQTQRTSIMNSVRAGNVQVLVSTDLLARGVDFESCDTVIHMDIPSDPATYLHRVGRAGRFGKQGLSVVIYRGAEESSNLNALQSKLGYRMQDLVLNVAEPKAPTPNSGKRKRLSSSKSVTPTHSVRKQKDVGNPESDMMAVERLNNKDDPEEIELSPKHKDIVNCNSKNALALNTNAGDEEVRGFDLDNWDAYAGKAYDEGYEDGFRRAFRIAKEMRSRLLRNSLREL